MNIKFYVYEVEILDFNLSVVTAYHLSWTSPWHSRWGCSSNIYQKGGGNWAVGTLHISDNHQTERRKTQLDMRFYKNYMSFYKN